jgi:hypothetical protein
MSQANVYHYVYSWFVYYGLPPTAIDAILATIVIVGRALIQLVNIEVDKNILISTLIY